VVVALYSFIVGFLFWISFPILLVVILLTGWHRRGLKERLAFYEPSSVGYTPPRSEKFGRPVLSCVALSPAFSTAIFWLRR